MNPSNDHGHGSTAREPATGLLAPWFNTPLFIRIAIGLALGLIVGLVLRPLWPAGENIEPGGVLGNTMFAFDKIAGLVMRFLSAVASPLILLAVIRSLMTTEIKGAAAGKLAYLLILNTVVAICVGLFVVNLLKPGLHTPRVAGATTHDTEHKDPLSKFLDSVPDSLVKPLVENNSIGVILLALSFGMAARKLPTSARATALKGVSVAFDLVVIVLHWVLELVPLTVFCRVAFLLTTKGVAPFKSLAWFVTAVIVALLLQSGYYLLRVALRSWVSPMRLLSGSRDALVMAFSTGSSVATMPLTHECMVNRVGIRADSSSLGVLVGGNFNHDGTALYEAMSALFVAQAIGTHLTIFQQLIVVLTSMVAAFGAAGIPEAGLVTMTLVFSAVGISPAYIQMVIPVDWFLDRCRTAINVMGDTSVACLLDGTKETVKPDVEPVLAIASEA